MRLGVKTTGSIMLLLTAIIWGCSFVAQSEAMDYMGPLTFQAARSFVGGAVLVPVLLLAGRGRKKYHAPQQMQQSGGGRKKLFLAGTLCGVVMFAAAMLQQYGIAFGTSGGKAGFITATYILLVPLFGLFRGKKVTLKIWICVLAALCGLYLLCITGGFSFAPSDGIVLLGAVFWALHILVIDHLAPGLDGISLSCIQFFVSGVLACVGMFLFETPSWQQILDGWVTIAYVGILSSGVGYTLQILGQQRTAPAVASLLMSFESVFAVLGGIVVLHQIPTAREWVGCTLMFAAVVCAQIPGRRERRIAAEPAQ
jgi:drug/metabolite transporter (DMT)-like permease